jgi:multidrug efflux system membrane fusion protein
VREDEVQFLQVGQAVELSLGSGQKTSGTIALIAPSAEQDASNGTRTVRVELEVKNPDGSIKPNVSATLDAPGGSRSLLGKLFR